MPNVEDILLSAVRSGQAGKRHMVAAACLSCRQKKQKCGGQRPCSHCAERNFKCVYDTERNETPRQAGKRKFKEMSQAFGESSQLLLELANGGEREALAIFQHLRAGESVATVLAQLQAGRIQDLVASRYEQRLQQKAVFTLCQSNIALPHLVNLASLVLNKSTRMNVVGQAGLLLKDKLITFELLTGILSTTNENMHYLEDLEDASQVQYFYVPAQPWTELTSNDEAVSHLISVFLRFGNGYWRFVEEDLFLRAIRSRKLSSEYCSPLLVNAMCSWASSYSEIDEAFKSPGQYVTRGNHFFDEARRLWELEHERPSMPNVSAMMIMAVDAAMRGKDVLAPTFCKAAITVSKNLPQVNSELYQDKSAQEYVRARRNIIVGVVWEELSNCTGLMRHLSSLTVTAKDLPSLEDQPDTVVYWTGYPFTKNPVKFRRNLLARERRTLAGFMEELLYVIAPGNTHKPEAIVRLTMSLGSRFTMWYDGLHPDLCHDSNMPAPLFEFHVQCCGLLVQLYNRAWIAAFGDSGSSAIEEVRNDPSNDAENVRVMEDAKAQFPLLTRKFSYRGATLLRDYRECYGMKICVPYLIQHAAENIFVLLVDLPLSEPSTSISFFNNDRTEEPISNTPEAFSECFRTLLGSGSQIMLPRAITRMVFHTALQLQIHLPDSVEQMLKLVAEMAWTISDLELLESMWPNMALKGNTYLSNDERPSDMGELLRRWEILEVQNQNAVVA